MHIGSREFAVTRHTVPKIPTGSLMSDTLDRLAVLVEPVRARLLRLLSVEELGVGEIARVVQLPQSTTSRHLKVLHTDGWVTRRREGTASLFRLADALPPGADAIWPAVHQAAQARWAAEDDLRLRAVLDARVVDSSSFFGRVAGRWEELRAELFGADYALPTLLSMVPPQWTVLDLGTGTGSIAADLAPVVSRVIAVDREQAMLDAAAARLEGVDNVELIQASLEDLPLEEQSVDAAIALLVLHHQPTIRPVLREAWRVLRPCGRFVVLEMLLHDREEYRATMGHQHLGFDPAELVGELGMAGFVAPSWRILPASPSAKGPPLFVVSATRCDR